jgi:serine O-acetyltransferase
VSASSQFHANAEEVSFQFEEGVPVTHIGLFDADGRLRFYGYPRHPIIEDDVVIYAGATILGRITVGRGAIISGNVWVTQDVPPGATITQARTRNDGFESGDGI